jgi:hypothetical protein
MDFKFVLMALTFMFLINFVAASMSGYNFLDAFTVRDDGILSKNITFTPACESALKNAALNEFGNPLYCEQVCASELAQSGKTTCEQLKAISPSAQFGATQTEGVGATGLGYLGDIFATVFTFVGTLVSSVLTFFLVAMQILIAPKNFGSFNIVIDMINAICSVIIIAWVWKVILPTASD